MCKDIKNRWRISGVKWKRKISGKLRPRNKLCKMCSIAFCGTAKDRIVLLKDTSEENILFEVNRDKSKENIENNIREKSYVIILLQEF